MKIHSTIANEAEKDIRAFIELQNRIYKPWQFIEHCADNVKLSTTLDELKLLWKEPLYVRPGYYADDQRVELPNFLSKLSYDDRKFIGEFTIYENKNTDKAVIYNHVDDLNEKAHNGLLQEELDKVINDEGSIDMDSFLASKLNQFTFMHLHYQKNIVRSINRLLKNFEDYFLSYMKKDTLKCIDAILSMDEKLFDLYHRFDYQYENPKVLIIDDDKKSLDQTASIRIVFLILLGFDVFIVSKKGYANIENTICRDFYDLHFEEMDTYENQEPWDEAEAKEYENHDVVLSKRSKMIWAVGAMSLILYLILLITSKPLGIGA